jgi:hypothetical protein
LADARKQATYVKKFPGINKDDAEALHRSLGAAQPGEQKEPTNFLEARDRGREMLEQWQAKLQAIKLAPVMKDEANLPKYQQEAE